MTQSSPETPRPETPRHDGFTPERQAAFLDALAASGSISAAAQAVGLSRTAIYNLRNREDEAGAAFRAAWDARLRQAVAVLSETAFDRAINGVEEPVFHKGEQVGTRIRHNDRLLMFLLKSLDPETYAARPATPAYQRPHPSGSRLRETPRPVSTSSTPADVADPRTLSTSSTDPETGFLTEPSGLREDPGFMAALRDLRHPPAEPSFGKRAARRRAARERLRTADSSSSSRT